ncbi:MAG: glycoside hydrolase family 1 protein [Candidatus Nealsonbacteria bacterium]|nr:glycoside hydrolase family 1 protein [Candidatus Nealsonbacteria bacterium]
MQEKITFPKEFLWGTATSSYQIEGGIDNSDWSVDFPAGKASDHYNKYREDIELMEKIGQNAYRFSLEWSRIEPREGEFDLKEIAYYRDILQLLKSKNIKAMVTLHHFTVPLWFSKKGGWSESKNVVYFVRFAQAMIKEYRELIDFWITINEPMIYSSKGFLSGNWPPKKKNIFTFRRVTQNQIRAHKKIFSLFHKTDPNVKVGIANNNCSFEPNNKKSFLDRFSVFLAESINNEYFLNKIDKHLDFIGLNYYFHRKIKFPFRDISEEGPVSDLGWKIYPKGIYDVLLELGEYGLPIYITENGLADKSDELRKDFIKDHLVWTHQAIEEGVDVRGYFHWSLMDNFEWDKGIEPRFGLVEIDYKTLERKIRPSADYYSEICKTNKILK